MNPVVAEQMQVRIKQKGFQADDIKHSGLLTVEQIQDIPLENVYEWVKTSKWKKKDFDKWCTALRII